MIGSAYTSKAIQAMLGPAHSSVIPDVLWVGLLDATETLIAMTGLTVSHDDFGPVTDGVANTTVIDCGVAGASWSIAYVALFDAASGGDVIARAAVSPAVEPTDGDTLAIPAGDLVFTYDAGA